jgi:hypothetical protein
MNYMDPVITRDFSDKKTLEKFSSAFTLSDMEIFIFPELFYPLVIADIMSPILSKKRASIIRLTGSNSILFRIMYSISTYLPGVSPLKGQK